MEEEQLQDSLDVVHAYREIQRKKSYDVWNLDCRLKGELSFTETNSKTRPRFLGYRLWDGPLSCKAGHRWKYRCE